MILGLPLRGDDHSKEAFDQNKMQRANEKREQRELEAYIEGLKYKKPEPSPSHRRTQIKKFVFCENCGNKLPVNTIYCNNCGQKLLT